ncbi:MAG: hypothetical protein Q9219_004315 [cf. Caloplaca sp. 3 TL-2023]
MFPAIFLLLAAFYSIAAAVPHERRQAAPAEPATTSGCFSDNPEAIYDPSCWATLDLTNWLNKWQGPNVCREQDLGINCCGPNEEWSTCFLRLGKHDSGFNCSQLQVNTNNCVYNPNLSPTLNADNRAQVRYILRTIFNVAAFFNDWYIALNFATQQAALTVESIVTTVAPPEGLSLTDTDILSGLVAGLPFFGAPVFAKAIDASKAGQALVTGLQQTPGLVKALFPTSGIDAQNIQIGTLNTVLADYSTKISQRINAGLWTVMSDKAAFAAFASSGVFSGNTALSIPKEAGELSAGLKLLVFSKALAGNEWALKFDRPTTSPGICEGEFATKCYRSDTFLSGTDAYIGGAKNNLFASGMLEKALENQWIASEAVLFESAVRCAASGQFGKAVVGPGADNTINTAASLDRTILISPVQLVRTA